MGKNCAVSGRKLLGEVERLLHARGSFVQVADHEAAVHHDPRLLAAADEAVSLFVILGIASVVVVLLHAVDDLDVAALEADAEQASASLVHDREELDVRADVGAAVGIERKLVAAADQLIGQAPACAAC